MARSPRRETSSGALTVHERMSLREIAQAVTRDALTLEGAYVILRTPFERLMHDVVIPRLFAEEWPTKSRTALRLMP